MANSAQARKRARQNEKRRQHNASHRSHMRTFVKKVIAATNSGEHDKAKAAYQASTSPIDKLVSKGLVHKNKAARQKRRLNAKVKALLN